MSSTTLVTFLLQAPSNTIAIDLFGSWDNFSKAYPMQRDLRMGQMHWRGCHSFTDIICDGDTLQASASRDGGLKMGGIYWYYYQLDGYTDYHNAAEPSTTSCPYLPGQLVNILEVPVQLMAFDDVDRCRSTSPTVPINFTLDPTDKFLQPEPPEPIETVDHTAPTLSIESSHKNIGIYRDNLRNVSCAKDYVKPHLSIGFRVMDSLTALVLKQHTGTLAYHSLPASRQQFIGQNSSHYRTVRSAGAGPWTSQSNQYMVGNTRNSTQHDKWRTFDQSVKHSSIRSHLTLSLNTAIPHSEITPVDSGSLTALKAPVQTHATVTGPLHRQEEDSCKFPIPQFDFSGERNSIVNPLLPQAEDADGLCTQIDQLQLDFSKSPRTETQELEGLHTSIISSDQDHVISYPTNSPCCAPYEEIQALASPEHGSLPGNISSVSDSFDLDERPTRNASFVSSHTSTSILSPSWSSTAFTGNLSPYHMSQPETPAISEFGDHHFGQDLDLSQMLTTNKEDTFNGNITHLESRGFHGYNLSETEYASALTLRNLPGTIGTSSKAGATFEQNGGHELIERWNNGANNGKTIMEDLYDDLSYLGGVIV